MAILLCSKLLLVDGIHASVSILVHKMVSKRKWNLATFFWICSAEQQLYDIRRTERFVLGLL